MYGHASWITLVIFGGMFLMRYLSTQRRRGGAGRQRGPGGPNRFTGPEARGPGVQPPSPPPSPQSTGASPSTGVPAGWLRDPFVRHEQRYWSGTEWTEHVIDDGVPSTDPPPTPPSAKDAD